MIMIWNYFLFTYRQMIRQKLFSIISITGLSLGMACFLLIFLYLQFQYSYDQFHEKKERIYRVNRYHDGENGQLRLSTTAACVGEIAREFIPEVESVVRLSYLPMDLHFKDKRIKEREVYATDPQFFNMFSFKLLKGNPSKAFSEPNSIVLTESLALKIFGSEEGLDQTIFTYDLDGKILPLKVTGILENVPANSHQLFKALVSFGTLRSFKESRWADENWYGCLTYFLLNKNASSEMGEKQLNSLTADILPDQGYQFSKLSLQPITSIFFDPMKDGWSQRGNISITFVLMILGVLILLVACLNYINLSIARSLRRIPEIGIRKVLGARKNQLLGQFLGESIFMSMGSLIIAILLLQLFIPAINRFSNILFTIQIDPNFFSNKEFLFVAFGTALITGILSGIYPALVLSGFKTVKALKGKSDKRGSSFMRKGLVVVQYVISITMIFGSIAVYKLYDHMKHQDLGFDKENIVIVNMEDKGDDPRLSYLKDLLIRNPGIENVAGTSKVPLSLRDDSFYYYWNSEDNKDKRISIVYADGNYFDLLNVHLVEKPKGDILKDESEKEVALVNQTFSNELSDMYPLGSVIELYNFNNDNERIPKSHPELIGSFAEFVDRNLIMNNSAPWIVMLSENHIKYLLIKLSEDFNPAILKEIENSFYQVFPAGVFEYSFIDDEINTVVGIINPFAKLIFFGTFFAIFIASMGLFALAMYITQQRIREIGIRKVFGATAKNITYLMTKQFIRLVLIAFVIAGPLTFWGLRFFFQIMPDRIELGWPVFIVVAIAIIGIGVLTVSLQSIKSARTNPVDTLHYE
jgi:putative ABC transport system permease protein